MSFSIAIIRLSIAYLKDSIFANWLASRRFSIADKSCSVCSLSSFLYILSCSFWLSFKVRCSSLQVSSYSLRASVAFCYCAYSFIIELVCRSRASCYSYRSCLMSFYRFVWAYSSLTSSSFKFSPFSRIRVYNSSLTLESSRSCFCDASRVRISFIILKSCKSSLLSFVSSWIFS